MFPLELGVLDPVTETPGVQKRLVNMGYECSESGEIDDATHAAVADFQRDNGLEATGEPDQVTRDMMVEIHGS